MRQQKKYRVIDEDTCREEAEKEGNGNDPQTVRNMLLQKCVDYVNGHEKWHDENLEPRIRALEDRWLWLIACGATIGALFTLAVTVIGLLSGILKWGST